MKKVDSPRNKITNDLIGVKECGKCGELINDRRCFIENGKYYHVGCEGELK